jgi:hypothetical protein
MTVFGGAGGRANEGRMQVDGLNTGAALNGGGVSTYVADISNAAEVVTTTSGGMGEAEVGGPSLSIVPKSGGNSVKGQLYLSGVSSGMVGDNYQKVPGFAIPGKLLQQWDYTGGVGGPIKKDRLWYYGTLRDEGQHRSIPGIYPNLNAGDPTKFTYLPDTTKQAQGAESFQLASIRLTFQATPRNKFNFHQDLQWPCNGSAFGTSGGACRTQPESGAVVRSLGLGGLTATSSPDRGAAHHGEEHPGHVVAPATNRLLLEAGWARIAPRGASSRTRESDARPRANHRAAGVERRVAGTTYRSQNWAQDWDSGAWRATAVRHRRPHLQGRVCRRSTVETSGTTATISTWRTFNGGKPASWREPPGLRQDRAVYRAYGQDQWTMGRMTVQGAALRQRVELLAPADNRTGHHHGQTFLDAIELRRRRQLQDVSPRGGWPSTFRNGKTSIKRTPGSMDPASNLNNNYSISNPIARIATTRGTGPARRRSGVPGTTTTSAVRLHEQPPTANARLTQRHVRDGDEPRPPSIRTF